MKFLVLFLLTAILLYAEKVTVTADHFEAYENKKISILTGHVHIQKGTDDINADRLVIELNSKNRPIRYILTGHVQFDIHTQREHYTGTAQKIMYDSAQKRYIAEGNVFLREKNSDKTLHGEKIVIDRTSGKTIITGKRDKPVKFTFTVEE
ncbi:MAG: lipopolysaccharide transport periplasmic protein LptA [Sulfurospirillum sp.]|nr:MAG: lipopolysaccharide transport periplasmic protein LptA [Sulfurospirillum sp.]